MASHLLPYLTFDGNCRDAMEFYQGILGGTLEIQTFGEAPMESPPELAERVMHAYLDSDQIRMMASDTPPGMLLTVGNNVNLSIVGPDEEKLTGVFNALAESGDVKVPLEKQFWGDIFGQATDRYGINWMVNVGELK
ncbi:MAG: VOC family protein [Solirubrobacterales bacterium]